VQRRPFLFYNFGAVCYSVHTVNQSETEQIKPKSPIAKREEEILAFWKENAIFEKSLEKESPKGDFIFYDGPPFATGLPHFGHILPTTMKDVLPRFKTMQGFHVPRRWGWDCHGLPIENMIEKELDLKNKKDIEDYGIGKFNAKARDSVLRYADEWKTIIPRLGRWVDMEHDYRTMNPSYTESVWWSFKTLFDKGRIYEGFKSMQICPHCGTTLSNFEVTQGYKDITDLSAYVKFELLDQPATFLVAWTTTPWTLPGNVALAVNPDVQYVKVKIKNVEAQDDGVFILAKERLSVLKNEYEVVDEMKGSDLIGKTYKPIFNYYQTLPLKNAEGKELTAKTGWKVYGADFVTTTDGTGIVHIAPGFGEDDLRLGQKENLPFIQHVTFEGAFKPEVIDFAGQLVKPKDDVQKADIEIIKYLAHHGTLFAKEKFIHSYPHCWRCETPLFNYATSSWFVRVSEFKEKLVKANSKVSWVPQAVGENRFGDWLANARDWAISRSRYWGAPLPVWKCETCEKVEALGSLKELKEKTRRNKFIIMRHGEALNNLSDLISDSPTDTLNVLTETGRKQVETSAQKLKGEKIDLIIASDILRTKETAGIVAKTLGMSEPILDERLREYKVGKTNIKTWGEFAKTHSYSQRFESALEEGETFAGLIERMLRFVFEIDSQYEGKTILLVSHQSPLLMLKLITEGNLTESIKNKAYEERYALCLEPAEYETLDFAAYPHNEKFELDFHRPYSDDLSWKCSCGGKMKRVPEVFDTWYDSGSVPFASVHYPFEHAKKKLLGGSRPEIFPADFIAEGLDQTRGWFYSLIVLGTELFGESPYKNVVVNGLILAEDGRKMSKSLKNYPPLMETVDTYSADALRYFLISSPAVKAEEVAFSSKGLDEVQKKILIRLQNVVSFYEMYKSETKVEGLEGRGSTNVLDRWMVTRLDEVREIMTSALEKYELDRASRPIADLVDDLSTWYLRRSRERFKGDASSGDASSCSLAAKADKAAALATTQYVLIQFSKLIAPFIPFTAEDVYQKVKGESDPLSVHLADWPASAKVDTVLLEQMAEVRKLVSLGLEARAKAGIKVRQPLASLFVKTNAVLSNSLLDLIKDEVNVKTVQNKKDLATEVELDTAITPILQAEGNMRELMRAIQDMRKEAGLMVGDRVTLAVDTDEAGKKLIEQFKTEITKVTGLSSIEFKNVGGEEVKAGEMSFKLRIEK